VSRARGEPRRRASAVGKRRSLLVFTEGLRTEPGYLRHWCVFDVDEHPNIVRALQIAEAREINVALSNPCIELWFVLHFQNQHASVHRADAQRISADLLGCGKFLTPTALDHLVPYHGDARQRAWQLDKKHELDGSPARSNPASDVWRLIDRIRPPDLRILTGRLRSFSVTSAERATHGTVQADRF
jgi:hypothetical protein